MKYKVDLMVTAKNIGTIIDDVNECLQNSIPIKFSIR